LVLPLPVSHFDGSNCRTFLFGGGFKGEKMNFTTAPDRRSGFFQRVAQIDSEQLFA
jgi:hypothetical protein